MATPVLADGPKRLYDSHSASAHWIGTARTIWPLAGSVRLRRRDRSEALLHRCLARLRSLLERERWHVYLSSLESPTEPHVLSARHSHKYPGGGWDLVAQATAGDLTVWRDGSRLRFWYVPSAWGLVVTTVLLMAVVGVATAFWLRFGTFGVSYVSTFDVLGKRAGKFAVAALLAYPAMRWRVKRTLKASMRSSELGWRLYESRWHLARRVVVSLALFGTAAVGLLPGLYDDWMEVWNIVVRGGSPPAVQRAMVIEVSWIAATVVVLLGLIVLVDWERVIMQGPAWVEAQWSRWRRRSWPIAAIAVPGLVLGRGWVGDRIQRAEDFVRTVRLESRRTVKADRQPLAITLPGQSRLVLEPYSSAAMVMSIARSQLTLDVTGNAQVDVGLDRDSIHIVGAVDALLLRGSYRVMAPDGHDVLDVKVEQGTALLRDRSKHLAITLRDGEQYRLRKY